MEVPNVDHVRTQIRKAITVTEFRAPPLRLLYADGSDRPAVPMDELIAESERLLGIPMPPWLRTVYQSCNGFTGPTGEDTLYRLDGPDGVAGFTTFLREQDWAPPWLARAIVFGYSGGSGSITTHSVALDGELVEWCYGDGARVTIFKGNLFDLWRRIQSEWDAVLGS